MAGAELPSGVVTFVFTDIEGSTRLFRRLGDAYPPLLARHNEILRASWEAHGGAEVKTEGDSFFVAFSDPNAAVAACVDVMEALEREPWPADSTIRVRAGMHTGVGYARDGDYIAFPVHQAARVAGVANGGQVLVSPATREVCTSLGPLSLHDLGRFRIRDFDEPISLFQAERAASPSPLPAPRAPTDDRHNLPETTSELLGRGRDADGVVEQLDDSRLVTVVGPGGVGKTRLAIDVGAARLGSGADEVLFVDLSAHRDPRTLPGLVADLTGVATGDGAPIDALVDHLAGHPNLVIFDNCEHITGGVADFVRVLLERSPTTSVLATSREPLALGPERVWRLGPLPADEAAADLFIARAGAVNDAFDPDDAERRTIVEICERLDGLPLAIELAAARVAALPPSEILMAVDDHLRLLRSRRRDLDERQRTLTGLLDWSYELLDDDEQLVLRRLSAFEDVFGLDAATAAMAGSGLDRIDVAEIVWSLVEKSLVMPQVGGGDARYRLLQTVRSYGRHQLTDADEAGAALTALGQWYVTRFEPTEPQGAVLAAQLLDELDNLRALAADLADIDIGMAQRIAWILGIHYRRAEPSRGLAELGPLLERLAVPGDAAVGLAAIEAQLWADAGDLAAAKDVLATGDRIREELGASGQRPEGSGWLENARASVAIREGRFDDALEAAVAGLAGCCDLELVSLNTSAAIAHIEQGELEGSVRAFEDVIEAAQRLGDPTIEAIATANAAELEMRRGHDARAAGLTDHASRLCVELGLRSNLAIGLLATARLAARADRWDDALRLEAMGRRRLEETGLHLYDSDEVLLAAMADEAADHLSDDQRRALDHEGRALDDFDAFQAASEVLTELRDGDADGTAVGARSTHALD